MIKIGFKKQYDFYLIIYSALEISKSLLN